MDELTLATIGVAIYNGMIAGAGYGFSGWMILGHDEKFDGPKFIRAMLIGAVVGVFAAFTGLPLPTADTNMHEILGNLGIMATLSGFLDQFAVWLWQRVRGLKPWKGGPTIEEIAPKATETLGGAMKERIAFTGYSSEGAPPDTKEGA